MMKTISANRSIAIVGAGFSGICVAAHLVFRAKSPLQIHMFERQPSFPGGEAFFTDNILHPLNVKASQMGALASDPEGFYHWVLENSHLLTCPVKPDSFLPRKVYRAYLIDLWEKVLHTATQKGIQLQLNAQEAVDVLVDHQQLEIITNNSSRTPVDALVIATGSPVSKTLSFENELLLRNPRYVADIWNAKLDIANSSSQEVLLIGSGLTAVDAISTLVGQGFKGRIKVVSSSGSFPECHLNNAVVVLPNYRAGDFTPRITSVLKKIRKDIAAVNGDWRQVVNALRPCTQELWKSFSLTEKKRFMRHLFSFWNKYRHRMPFESGERMNALANEGRLSIQKGIVDKVKAINPNTLLVSTQGRVDEMDYVIKCSGPEYAIAKQGNQFLNSLFSKGLIELDPLGLGLGLEADFSIKGSVPGKIFALGGLLFGELFETTAVPEIRAQADRIAQSFMPA